MSVSRRELLKFAVATAPTAVGLAALANAMSPVSASADSLGVLVDYAAGGLSGLKAGGPGRLTTTNVRSFGAVGDGVADDTAAIHAARDAAGLGGTVLFPPGTYNIVAKGDGGLRANVADQVWQVMPGANLTQTGNARSLITVDAARVTIGGGGTLTGTRDALGDDPDNVVAVILGAKNSNRLTIHNVTIQKSSRFAAWLQGSQSRVLGCSAVKNRRGLLLSSHYLAVQIGSSMEDTYDMEVSDCYFDRSDEDPATIDGAAIQIRGNKSGGVAPDDVDFHSYRGKVLRNTILMPPNPANKDGRVCGIEFGAHSYCGLAADNKIVNGTMGISFSNGDYGRAINNTLIGQTLFAIEVADSPGCVIQGNAIDGSGRLGSLPDGCGIITNGSAGRSTDVSIVGNRIFGIHNSGRGISLGKARVTVTGNNVESKIGMTLANVSGANVSGNTIHGNGSGQGVQLVNCKNIVVSGNTVQSSNVGVQIHGSSGVVDNLNVSNNRFWECTIPVDVVMVSGDSLSHNTIKDNYIGPP